MRTRLLGLLLALCAAEACADGLTPMELKDVLPRASAVVVVQIIFADGTITATNRGEQASVSYSYAIKAKVLSRVKGTVPGEQLNLSYQMVVMKGMWLSWPGSGLELQMKPDEKYVFLLESPDGKLRLLRAEKESSLQVVKDLLEGQAKQRPAGKTDVGDGK